MSGAPKHKAQAASGAAAIDLDALLAARTLAPRPVKFRGHTYAVRTDLTPAEVVRYHQLAQANEDAEAFAILVGAEDAARLDAALNAIPTQHVRAAVRGLLDATGCFTGLVADDEPAGGTDQVHDDAGKPSAS